MVEEVRERGEVERMEEEVRVEEKVTWGLGRQDSRDHNSYRRKYARGEKSLSNEERRFMLNAERGDCATVAKMIESNVAGKNFDINCMDPLGRTALSIAIINENPELMEILLDNEILTYDSLLLAIHEEYVEVGGEPL